MQSELGMLSELLDNYRTMSLFSDNTPRPILSSRTPVTPSLSWPWGFGFVDFNITFDQQVIKSRPSLLKAEIIT